jgi:hypothetical protein
MDTRGGVILIGDKKIGKERIKLEVGYFCGGVGSDDISTRPHPNAIFPNPHKEIRKLEDVHRAL